MAEILRLSTDISQILKGLDGQDTLKKMATVQDKNPSSCTLSNRRCNHPMDRSVVSNKQEGFGSSKTNPSFKQVEFGSFSEAGDTELASMLRD